MYSIKWQKRGLPHAHIHLWLQEKIHPSQIDSIICAELPNPQLDPVLFEVIKSQMVHGPCGRFNPNSPCMDQGKSTKRFPRELLKDTQTGHHDYPLYRRRKPQDGGHIAKITKRVRGQSHEVEIDKKWIVPYSPLLSRAFNAHINMEFFKSVKSIKYVYKYIKQGSDMVVFYLREQDHDEVRQYQTGRDISSNEAVWRILGFPIHERHPTIQHLAVHLENGQRVFFNPASAPRVAQEPPKAPSLTAFFKLSTEDDFVRTIFYWQVSQYYTWSKSSRKWQRRKAGKAVDCHPGIKSSDVLGRIYQFECFFLRMVLFEVRGPQSFQELRTVHEDVCSTYREAC